MTTPKTSKQSLRVSTRFTTDEYAQLQATARAMGCTVAEAVRRLARRAYERGAK